MKKIFSLSLILLAVFTLVSCGPEKRVLDPVILGVQSEVEVQVGDNFDPLEGITAKESDAKGAKDITDLLKHTFNESMLDAVGEKTFSISVTNADGRTITENVKLIVSDESGSGRSNLVLVAPNAITYYIGSKAFNPLEEVRAYVSGTGEAVDVEITSDDYTTRVPGEYSFVVSTLEADGIPVEKTIKLVVKAKADIPTDLSKTEPIEITLWHSNGTTIEEELIKYGDDFEALMSQQGYNVTVNIVKNGATYDEIRTNMVNALKGGKLPNIIQNYPDHVVEYEANGAISSLTPYIYHPIHGYDENDPSEMFTDILESYRQEQRATNDNGDYLSLPFNKSTEVVVYNKLLFDAVLKGAPFPDTWQELFELYPEIMSVKDQIIDQIAQRWAASGSPLTAGDIQKAKTDFVPFTYDSSDNAFITLVRQFGGSYTSRGSDGVGRLEFDNAITKDMLNFFGNKEGGKMFTVPANWEVGYANAVSTKGTTVFSVGSTGGLRYNNPVNEGFELYEVGVAPIPYDQYSPESRSVIQQGTNMSLTTQGTAQEKLASWLFIKYLTSAEIQSKFGIVTGYSPIRNSVYETDEAYAAYLAEADTVMESSYIEQGLTKNEYTSLYELKLKAMGARAAAEQRQYQYFDTPFIGSSAARDAVGVAFDRVILANANADLAKEIRDAIAYAIAEANKTIGK